MGISKNTLNSVKSAPLSTVIEATGAKLKRIGREFVTQCLWHDDTNPSLTINDDKGFCFCHVCRGGGDANDYLQKKYGIGFREAVEKACQILEIAFEVDDEDPVVTKRRQEERKAAILKLEKQQAEFKANIRDKRGARIRQILIERGITKEAAVEFGIGFASSGPFAGRITIPIYNHRNELVGFTGRATRPDVDAKYKNSETSEIFDKKSLVFNEQRAAESARETGSIVFVEGHIDVISMWQVGIKNAVALQGTGAPDPLILKRLAKKAKTFILCFDGDSGGRKAAEQFISIAGPMAMAGEISINIASLPEKKDPDEIIRSGGDLYAFLTSAPSWLDWVIDTWASALDMTNTAAITDVELKLRALINSLRSKALRAHYIDKAARVLTKNNKEAEKLAKQWGDDLPEVATSSWVPRDLQQSRLAAERRLLRLYVHCPDKRKQLRVLMEKVQHPALVWLVLRIKELESLCRIDLTPHSAMAIVSVAEPHHMTQLRTLIRPNVIIDDSDGVLAHLASKLDETISFTGDEPDPN